MSTYVGIDIGSESIKMVQLRKTGNGFSLEKAGYSSIKEIPFYDGMNNAGQISEAVKWVLENNDIKSAVASVSLPMNMIYSKYITLPFVSEEKIKQIIQFEIGEHIPFAVEEVYWDYTVFGKAPKSNEVNVLLHVVKKDVVTDFVNNLAEAGIDIIIIDVMNMALYNSLIESGNYEETILIDIGAKNTNVILMENDNCWSRALPIGGEDFDTQIAKDLNIAKEKAEQLKKDIGLQGEGKDAKVSKAISKVSAELVKEIQRTIGFYRNKAENLVIKRVVLSGGNARIKGISSLFMDKLGLDVEIFDPFRKIDINPNVGAKNINKVKSYFACAVGLALRHIKPCATEANLIPPEVLDERYAIKNRIFLWLSIGVLVFFFILLNLGIVKSINKNKQILNQADTALVKYKSEKLEFEKLKSEIIPIETSLKKFQNIINTRMIALDIISNIRKVIFNDVWIDSLKWNVAKTSSQRSRKSKNIINTDNRVIYLTGRTTDSFKKLDSFKTAILSSSMFKNVIVNFAEEYEDEKSKKYVRFSMIIKLEKDMQVW
jgi:type IV pilus assembly protein PilM